VEVGWMGVVGEEGVEGGVRHIIQVG